MIIQAINAYNLGAWLGVASVQASTGNPFDSSRLGSACIDQAKLELDRLRQGNIGGILPGGMLDGIATSFALANTLDKSAGQAQLEAAAAQLGRVRADIPARLRLLSERLAVAFELGLQIGLAEGQSATSSAASMPYALQAVAAARLLAERLGLDGSGLVSLANDIRAGIQPAEAYGRIVSSRAMLGSMLSMLLSREGGWEFQQGWCWCSKCSGLFHGGGVRGICPAGGKHDGTTSGEYFLVMNRPEAPGQHGWRWCERCLGLVFGGGGICKADPDHPVDPAHPTPHVPGITDYVVPHAAGVDPATDGQQGWRWCSGCHGLYFAGATSVCTNGGSHGGLPSGHYAVDHNPRT